MIDEEAIKEVDSKRRKTLGKIKVTRFQDDDEDNNFQPKVFRDRDATAPTHNADGSSRGRGGGKPRGGGRGNPNNRRGKY